MSFDLLINNENKEANSILSSPLHVDHGGLMIEIHTTSLTLASSASVITAWTAQKSTRIQNDDERFVMAFRTCCDGHNGAPHDRLEGGDLTAQSAFYPKRFCERAAQLLMEDGNKKDLRHLHNVFLAMVEVINEHDPDDNAMTFTELEMEEITETYFTIEEELVAPALSEILREPNEDGAEDETLLNRLR